MARDAKKKPKKRHVKKTEVRLDAKNREWKRLVDGLPANSALPLYDEDVDQADRNFWDWRRVPKKFYCPTADDERREERLRKIQMADLYGPKSKYRRYVAFESVPVCTSDPKYPLLSAGNPYLRQGIDRWRRQMPRSLFVKRPG
jgi:hypothetical protein